MALLRLRVEVRVNVYRSYCIYVLMIADLGVFRSDLFKTILLIGQVDHRV